MMNRIIAVQMGGEHWLPVLAYDPTRALWLVGYNPVREAIGPGLSTAECGEWCESGRFTAIIFTEHPPAKEEE